MIYSASCRRNRKRLRKCQKSRSRLEPEGILDLALGVDHPRQRKVPQVPIHCCGRSPAIPSAQLVPWRYHTGAQHQDCLWLLDELQIEKISPLHSIRRNRGQFFNIPVSHTMERPAHYHQPNQP